MSRPRETEPEWQSSDFASVAGIFRYYSFGATIAETGSNSVPKSVMHEFEWRSKRFIDPRQYHKLDFHALYRVTHANEDTSFVAWQTKLLVTAGLETTLYLADVYGKKFAGLTEIRYDLTNPKPFFRNKPFGEWTKTEDEFLRRGLGLRRTLTANALCLAFFDLPFRPSGHFIDEENNPPSLRTWKGLERIGLAVPEAEGHWFVFREDPKAYAKAEKLLYPDTPAKSNPRIRLSPE